MLGPKRRAPVGADAHRQVLRTTGGCYPWLIGRIECAASLGYRSLLGQTLNGHDRHTTGRQRGAAAHHRSALVVRARAHGARFGRIPLQAPRPLSANAAGATTRCWSRARRAHLRAGASRRGERVAIMGDACEEWMICDLAAQSLGAIVYGIYPTASASEVEYQMRDGGAVVFIAENQEYVDKILPFAERLPDAALDRGARRFGDVRLSRIQSSGAIASCSLRSSSPSQRGSSGRWSRCRPEQPAFIVYTSGTTGHPKGALVTHGKHLAATANMVDHYPTLVEKEHRTVVFLPLCHVLGRDVAMTLPLISRPRAAFRRGPGRSRHDAVRDRADRAVHRAALSAEIRLAGAGRHCSTRPASSARPTISRCGSPAPTRAGAGTARSGAGRRRRSIALCQAAVSGRSSTSSASTSWS